MAILLALRADAALAALPVIVCAAALDLLAQYAADLRALNADVLAKPFALDDLLARVVALIGSGEWGLWHAHLERRCRLRGPRMGDDRREGDAVESPPDWFAIMGALTTLHGYAELLHRRIARGQRGRLSTDGHQRARRSPRRIVGRC